MNYNVLSEVAEVIDSLHKTPIYSEEGEPMVRSTDVAYGYLDLSKALRVSKEVFDDFSRRYMPKKNDIIITRVGSYGRLALVKDTNFCLGQNTTAIIPKIDPRYLYFTLNSLFVKNQIESLVVGTTQKTLSLKAINSLKIPRFDELIEKKISKYLANIDDKITVNNQINETLEAMAQAIFKSWFIDFDPVRAKMKAKEQGLDADGVNLAAMRIISSKTDSELETMKQVSPEDYNNLENIASHFPEELVESELGLIPKGWEVSEIDSVCEFQNGYAFKSKELEEFSLYSYKVFKMGSIKKGGGISFPGKLDFFPDNKNFNYKKFLIKKYDLLMCMTDMKNNVALLGHTAIMPENDTYILNQRVGRLRSKDINIVNYSFLYLLSNNEFFLEDLRSRANSGVQVNLSTKEIKNSKFVLPTAIVHQKFDSVVCPMFEIIFNQLNENKTLIELRDSLLPKLLSGEIEV